MRWRAHSMGAVGARASSHRCSPSAAPPDTGLPCRSNPMTCGHHLRFEPTLQSLRPCAPRTGQWRGGHGGRAILPRAHDEASGSSNRVGARRRACGCASGVGLPLPGGAPRRACPRGPSMPRGRWEVGPTSAQASKTTAEQREGGRAPGRRPSWCGWS
jgi:hypothetical protein